MTTVKNTHFVKYEDLEKSLLFYHQE